MNVKKSRTGFCILLAHAPVLGTPGCGRGGRAPEPIAIVGQGRSSAETIVSASGTFSSSPITQTNVPASWYLLGPGLDPPPAGSTLTSQSFSLLCGGYTAIAVAPTDPNTPSSGTIPATGFRGTGHRLCEVE
jgi:hypothetical protein